MLWANKSQPASSRVSRYSMGLAKAIPGQVPAASAACSYVPSCTTRSISLNVLTQHGGLSPAGNTGLRAPRAPEVAMVCDARAWLAVTRPPQASLAARDRAIVVTSLSGFAKSASAIVRIMDFLTSLSPLLAYAGSLSCECWVFMCSDGQWQEKSMARIRLIFLARSTVIGQGIAGCRRTPCHTQSSRGCLVSLPASRGSPKLRRRLRRASGAHPRQSAAGYANAWARPGLRAPNANHCRYHRPHQYWPIKDRGL